MPAVVPAEVVADPEPAAAPVAQPPMTEAQEAAAHVLERQKASGLLPPAFFELDPMLRDAIEALFFHTYAAQKGLQIVESDVEVACLTIGAPGVLESIFHTTSSGSGERSSAVTAAYAELLTKDFGVADLKRQLKNLAKEKKM